MKHQMADPSDLQGLLDSCHRNGRPPRFPVKGPKIFFDADRFRWLCRNKEAASGLFNAAIVGGWGRDKIRELVDAEMRMEPE